MKLPKLFPFRHSGDTCMCAVRYALNNGRNTPVSYTHYTTYPHQRHNVYFRLLMSLLAVYIHFHLVCPSTSDACHHSVKEILANIWSSNEGFRRCTASGLMPHIIMQDKSWFMGCKLISIHKCLFI